MTTINPNQTIGSSEVFRLLERKQYGLGCRRELAYTKLGYKPDYPVDRDDPVLRRGNRLEPIAAEIYQEKTGRTVRRTPTRVHKKFPWARASTDRIISADRTLFAPKPDVGDLEIKTRAEGPFKRVLRQGAFDGDELQVQWSMWVSGHRWGSLAILGLCGDLPLLWWDREPDKELQEIFSWEGAKFAQQVFRDRELPEPTFPASDPRCKVCAFRQQCRGEEIDADEFQVQKAISESGRQIYQVDNPTLATTLWDYQALKEEKEALEESMEAVKDAAVEQMANLTGKLGEGAWVRGFGKVTHFEIASMRFDVKQFKRDQPDVWERYAKRSISYQFRIYPQGAPQGAPQGGKSGNHNHSANE